MKADLQQLLTEADKLSDEPVLDFSFSQQQVFWVVQQLRMAQEHPFNVDQPPLIDEFISYLLTKANLPSSVETYLNHEIVPSRMIQISMDRFLVSGLVARLLVDRLCEITHLSEDFLYASTAAIARQAYASMTDKKKEEGLRAILDFPKFNCFIPDQVIEDDANESSTF